MEHGIKYMQIYKVDNFLALPNCQVVTYDNLPGFKCWGMKILEGIQLGYDIFENLFVRG